MNSFIEGFEKIANSFAARKLVRMGKAGNYKVTPQVLKLMQQVARTDINKPSKNTWDMVKKLFGR